MEVAYSPVGIHIGYPVAWFGIFSKPVNIRINNAKPAANWWYWKFGSFDFLLHVLFLRILSTSALCLALILVPVALKSMIHTAITYLILIFTSYSGLFSRITTELGMIFDLKFSIYEVENHVLTFVLLLGAELLSMQLIIAIRQRFYL